MLRIILLVSCGMSLWACGKGQKKKTEEVIAVPTETVGESGAEASADAVALNGQELYARLCASCHQTLDKTDVPKAPLKKINSAITDEPAMAALKATKAQDIEAIAAALGTVSPGKGKN